MANPLNKTPYLKRCVRESYLFREKKLVVFKAQIVNFFFSIFSVSIVWRVNVVLVSESNSFLALGGGSRKKNLTYTVIYSNKSARNPKRVCVIKSIKVKRTPAGNVFNRGGGWRGLRRHIFRESTFVPVILMVDFIYIFITKSNP